ncbi:hypothetical protein [Corynebacterium flavescens]|uniref:hypothetical protein n=1 Tax=Corynebacterium flavescens TaxID=28028 RepID=UPI00289E378F|nr:hypothetical protein [Corynebacterium flavescens]
MDGRGEDQKVHKDVARKSLEFQDQVTAQSRSGSRFRWLLNLAIALAVPGFFLILTQGPQWPAWSGLLILAVVYIASVVGLAYSHPKVRTSYRQAPETQVKPDMQYLIAIAIILLPGSFFILLSSRLPWALLLAVCWAIAIFWVLQTRMLDVNARS